MKGFVHTTAVGLIALLMASASAFARGELVSADFDGVYAGATELTAGSDPDRCQVGWPSRIRVDQGIFQREKDGGPGPVWGFVTSDGFFTGTYRLPSGNVVPFEGLVDGSFLIGGLIAADDGCRWLLEANQ